MGETAYLKRIFGFLQEKVDISSFEKRLILQKKVFLLQNLAKLPLNFNFSWYTHGPYSTELADFGYANEGMIFEKPVNFAPSKELVVLTNLFKRHESDVLWFETVASISYLRDNVALDKKNNIPAVCNELTRRKPHLKDRSIGSKNLKIVDYCDQLWKEVQPLFT